MSIFSAIKEKIVNPVTDAVGLTSEQGRADAEIIAPYESELETAAKEKVGYERQWYINIAMVLGYHYLIWDSGAKKFYEPKVPDYRVRMVLNEILPRYRKSLRMASKYDPRAFVTPNSDEAIDKEAAELGTKACAGFAIKVGMKRKLYKNSQWQLLCGTSFMHYFWNPQLGEQVGVDGETGLPIMAGDVDAEEVSPYEMFPLDNPIDMETCNRMARCSYVSLDFIRETWPEKGELVKEEKDITLAGQFRDRIDALVNSGAGSGGRELKGKAILKRIYERPSAKNPGGKYIAYANGVVLETGDLPDVELGREFEMPFCKYDDIEVPGRFWGQSTIEQMTPLNKAKNKVVSQIIESANLMSKPKWFYVAGSISKTALTSAPGEKVEVKMSAPGAQYPQTSQPKELPRYVVVGLPQLLTESLQNVGAQHEVSKGQVPSGVDSGVAIQQLQQSDDDQFASIFEQSADNKRQIYTAFLKMAQERYTEERNLKMFGEDKSVEIVSFMGAELKNNTDVWVETTDMMPMERGARQAFILQLYDKGLYGDPMDDNARKRALRALEFGQIDELWQDAGEDYKQARFENKQMDKGVFIPAEAWHVHPAHLIEHFKPMKSPLFLKKPQAIRDMYNDHVDMHINFEMGIGQIEQEQAIEAEQAMLAPEDAKELVPAGE